MTEEPLFFNELPPDADPKKWYAVDRQTGKRYRMYEQDISLKRVLLGFYRKDYPELQPINEESIDLDTFAFLIDVLSEEPADVKSKIIEEVLALTEKLQQAAARQELASEYSVGLGGVASSFLQILASLSSATIQSFEITYPQKDSLGLDVFRDPLQYSLEFGMHLALQGQSVTQNPRGFMRNLENDRDGQLRYSYMCWLADRMYQAASPHLLTAYQAPHDIITELLKSGEVQVPKPHSPEATFDSLTRKQRVALVLAHYKPEDIFSEYLPQVAAVLNRWSKVMLSLLDYLRVVPHQSRSMKDTDQVVMDRSEVCRQELLQFFFDLYQKDAFSPEQISSVFLFLFENLHLGEFLAHFPNRSIQRFATGLYAEVNTGLFFLDKGMVITKPENVSIAERMGEDLRVGNMSVQVKGDIKAGSMLSLFQLSIPEQKKAALAWVKQKDSDGSKGYAKTLETLEVYARQQGTLPILLVAPTKLFGR